VSKHSIPATVSTPLVRTCFDRPDGWSALLAALSQPSVDGFLANLSIIDESRFSNTRPSDYKIDSQKHAIVFFADEEAQMLPGYLLLVVSAFEPSMALRVLAKEAWSIENNLSLSNMDFAEFVSAAGRDGVFRGF
jgi:hypothetical protein